MSRAVSCLSSGRPCFSTYLGAVTCFFCLVAPISLRSVTACWCASLALSYILCTTLGAAGADEILPAVTSAGMPLIFRPVPVLPAECGAPSSRDFTPRGAPGYLCDNAAGSRAAASPDPRVPWLSIFVPHASLRGRP